MPTVVVADISQSSPPAIQRTATAYFSEGATIGQRACFQFIVPGGTIARIRRLSFFSTNITAADAWFILFSAETAALGLPSNQANMSFTDGRLQESGAIPSCQLWYGRKISTLPADWALPLFMVDTTYGSAQNSYVPSAGWIVGSGKPGVSSYLEGAFDGVNMPQSGVIEWEEFQVG